MNSTSAALDGDLGLAFARDSQTLLRQDLRLLVMSATLDGAAVARLLGDAPVIESQGRMFEVATRYLGRDPTASIEDQTVRAVLRALDQENGGVLVFLPGQGEIERTAERLRRAPRRCADGYRALHGALESLDQDLAIAPAAAGRRKVVLATSIAQTSLTIEGIGVVVDTGLARVPRFDPASGVTRLATVRVSRAAADQRRGRAGRTGPGVCYRLWDETETRALIPADRPEILETDLTRLALALARWGARDAETLALLDKPPPGALARARSDLAQLGALDEAGALTAHGTAMSRPPLPPRLAHMIIAAAAYGHAGRAAQIAVLITERGLGGASSDLSQRLDRFAADRSPRARAAAALAARLAGHTAGKGRAARLDDGLILALAFPERIAKARYGAGNFQLAGGRGVRLDPGEALAREPWLAVAELGGGAARDRILLAARLNIDAYRRMFPGALRREERLESGLGGRLRAKETLWLGALAVEERLIADPDPALIEAALFDEVRRQSVDALPWGDGAKALRARVAFLRAGDQAWPDLSDGALADHLDYWLAPLLVGKSSLAQISDTALEASLRERIAWPLSARLDTEAPTRWTAPTGTIVAIAYGESGPSLEVRVQELFGLGRHPSIGRGTPLALHLLSPARRPIQVTTDLPGFWRGSWAEVRKAMRGRYPKHPWPEDPLAAPPTTRAKPRA